MVRWGEGGGGQRALGTLLDFKDKWGLWLWAPTAGRMSGIHWCLSPTQTTPLPLSAPPAVGAEGSQRHGAGLPEPWDASLPAGQLVAEMRVGWVEFETDFNASCTAMR